VVRAIEGEVPLQVEQAAAAAANHRCLLADLLGVCFGEQEGNCQFFRGDLLTCCLTSNGHELAVSTRTHLQQMANNMNDVFLFYF
jgi:hypothetical protein